MTRGGAPGGGGEGGRGGEMCGTHRARSNKRLWVSLSLHAMLLGGGGAREGERTRCGRQSQYCCLCGRMYLLARTEKSLDRRVGGATPGPEGNGNGKAQNRPSRRLATRSMTSAAKETGEYTTQRQYHAGGSESCSRLSPSTAVCIILRLSAMETLSVYAGNVCTLDIHTELFTAVWCPRVTLP